MSWCSWEWLYIFAAVQTHWTASPPVQGHEGTYTVYRALDLIGVLLVLSIMCLHL